MTIDERITIFVKYDDVIKLITNVIKRTNDNPSTSILEWLEDCITVLPKYYVEEGKTTINYIPTKKEDNNGRRTVRKESQKDI